MPDDRRPEPVELREVSDARTLRALTHPIRVALIEILSLGGPLTASEAGERLGESPASCSFHLRQLARYGFVEEAGGGRGRARPWRMRSLGMRFSATEDDPASQVAAEALARLVRHRALERLEVWQRTRGNYPRAWREAASSSEHVYWMTPHELQALGERLADELGPLHQERRTDPARRPAGALPVELLLFTYPLAPPEPGG